MLHIIFAVLAILCSLNLYFQWLDAYYDRKPLQSMRWRYHFVVRWWWTPAMVRWSMWLVGDLLAWAALGVVS